MKKNIVLIIILLMATGATTGAVIMRKELPYHFDIVQLENAIAINQHETWSKRELGVEIKKDGATLGQGTLNSATHSSIIDGIAKNVGRLEITIGRMDFIGKIRYRPARFELDRKDVEQRYLVLIGASIGEQWNLEEFNERKKLEDVAIGNRIRFEFDKRALIEPLFKYQHKPDAAIIKECSEYFPRNLDRSIEEIKSWVNLLKANHITPVLATTTPVAEIEGNFEQQKSIDRFNELLREYARSNGIKLLDLARALQKATNNHFMKDEYSQEDGYHLTPKAYREVLDNVLASYLKDNS